MDLPVRRYRSIQSTEKCNSLSLCTEYSSLLQLSSYVGKRFYSILYFYTQSIQRTCIPGPEDSCQALFRACGHLSAASDWSPTARVPAGSFFPLYKPASFPLLKILSLFLPSYTHSRLSLPTTSCLLRLLFFSASPERLERARFRRLLLPPTQTHTNSASQGLIRPTSEP